MAKIDNPFDQIELQHRDGERGQSLAVGLNFAAPLISLFTDSPVAALASITALAAGFGAQHRWESRIEAMQDGFKEAVGDLDVRMSAVEKKVIGPDAEEAIVVACRHALSSARLDKARAFGRILGATIARDEPNWREAAEFIRNLEEFSTPDLEALKLLWTVQRTSFRVMAGARREMSTGADEYNTTWKDVLSRTEKAGISKDEWYARCARLSGFGLTISIRANPSYVGPDDMCYRLTSRGVRLLGLLGRNINPAAYPAVRYFADGHSVTVNDEDEEKKLPEGWADTPKAFAKGPEG